MVDRRGHKQVRRDEAECVEEGCVCGGAHLSSFTEESIFNKRTRVASGTFTFAPFRYRQSSQASLRLCSCTTCKTRGIPEESKPRKDRPSCKTRFIVELWYVRFTAEDALTNR